MATMRCSFVTLLTVSLALTGIPDAPTARAQTSAACDAAIDALERDTHQLGAQLEQDVREFVRSDATETALKGIRNHYKSKPTSEALFDLKDKWDKWNEYVEHLKNARATLEDLQRCLNTGCPLNDFVKRQHQAIAKWIQSLVDDGINAAIERVNKAAKLIQNYVADTLDLAMGGALATVQQCNTRFEQQAGSTTPQPATTPPGAGATPPSAVGTTSDDGGLGTAMLGAVVALASGITAGLLLYEPTPTIVTPLPPAPPPSAGQCISTRSCTINLNGSCGSCAGTVNGPCNWTSPTPLGTENSVCSQGVPCARGFSCNNGRCRSGSSNACPVQ